MYILKVVVCGENVYIKNCGLWGNVYIKNCSLWGKMYKLKVAVVLQKLLKLKYYILEGNYEKKTY